MTKTPCRHPYIQTSWRVNEHVPDIMISPGTALVSGYCKFCLGIAALRDRSEAQEVLVNRRRRWWSARNDGQFAVFCIDSLKPKPLRCDPHAAGAPGTFVQGVNREAGATGPQAPSNPALPPQR